MNWITISGSFIADSAYTYICLGNHFDDSLTTSVQQHAVIFGYNAYYYLDDVCVSTDSMTCSAITQVQEINSDKSMYIFPNPFHNNIYINIPEGKEYDFRLYDITGRNIIMRTIKNSSPVQTTSLSKGLYFYEVRQKDSAIKKGKIIKE